MLSLALVALGLGLFAAGAWLLARLGPAYRVGRLLRAAPLVSVGEAERAAQSGQQRYLRVHGRIRSEEEFPDESDRPLVFRRTRLEVLERGRWRVLEEERLAVPFGVEERGAALDVDVAALGDGLVVLPREASGRAAEIRERIPRPVPDDALVRHRVDQISAVERAFVAGVPALSEGRAVLTAGLGRPLIVSTLDPAEAIRVLSAGRRRQVVAAAVLMAAGLAALALAAVLAVADVLLG